MANLEINASSSVCRKCGRAYGRLKGYFPICYAYLYKGVGYLPYCSDCCRQIYDSFYAECGDSRAAMRQFCRKFDLYWKDDIYERAAGKTGTRTLMQNYIARLNNSSYIGKSYDDTLRDEGLLWHFSAWHEEPHTVIQAEEQNEQKDDPLPTDAAQIELTDEIIAFWGPGYTPDMYRELEQRLRYYRSQMGEDTQTDLGTEMLLRQIASLELDINKARASGASTEKMVTSLNAMLSNLKKPQKGAAADTVNPNTPFGVWIKRWENEKPVPEPDEELQDADHLIKYITVWFFGHLCKMLGIKNSYCKMYEDEIARLRVERPEYDEEDDDTFLNDLFGGVDLDHHDLQETDADGMTDGNGGDAYGDDG